MSLDMTVLRLLRHKDRYDRMARAVPQRALDQRTSVILADFGRFFNETGAGVIDSAPFTTWFKLAHPKLRDEDLAIYAALFKQFDVAVEPGVEVGIMERLVAADAAAQMAELLQKWNDGEEVDLYAGMRAGVDRYEEQRLRRAENWQELTPIEDMLAELENDVGLHWRLPCLNKHMRPLVAGDSVIVAGRPDKGKCQSPDTPILMADGRTVLAKDVRVGDVLAGPHMNNTVLSVTSGVDDMYRVSYPWGEGYTVNAPHVLSLKRSKAEGVRTNGGILNVPVEEYIQWPESRRARYKGWKAGIDLPASVQPMPAYLLGCWLGDGHAAAPSITTADPEVLAAFVEVYGEPSRSVPAGAAASYFFPGAMTRALQDAGVWKNKHIPDTYLRASREQRLELLAGIIDSDGHAGDVYEVVTKLACLKDAYVWLARSLGFHAVASKTFKRATNADHAGDWYWRVRIGAEAFGVVPVRLERKRGNTKARKRQGLHFGITAAPVGRGEYVGWELSGDRLYMLGDFTVTHNTTFCADQLTYMASQVDKLWPGENRSILWFNNEGPSKRIVERCFQAALGATFEELYKLSAQPATEEPERFRTLLRQRYAAALGGRPGVLRVLSAHGRSSYEVEEQIKRYRPALVVFDMVDNIQFGGTASNNGQRTDQLLEAMYQWARLAGVRYDAAVISTSQLSADADGLQFPTLPQLKDSKTGKQGAADVIITIGSVNDPTLANSRWIGCTKNKKVRTGVPASPMCEVIYDGARARYREVP